MSNTTSLNIHHPLIRTDQYCDYIPLASTITNLVDIFEKGVFLFLPSSSIENNRYFSHIQEKSLLRCIVLIVPILGNLIIGIYDKIQHHTVSSLSSPKAVEESRFYHKVMDHYIVSDDGTMVSKNGKIKLGLTKEELSDLVKQAEDLALEASPLIPQGHVIATINIREHEFNINKENPVSIYEVEKNPIGKGEWAHVYKVTSVTESTFKALKTSHTILVSRPIEALQQIENEYEVLTKLGPMKGVISPPCYIIGVKKLGDLGKKSLLFEFIEGENLQDSLTKGMLKDASRATRFHLAQQICEMYLRLQNKGLLHGDLNPENIMLKPQGENLPPEIVIIDFGKAKFMDPISNNKIPPLLLYTLHELLLQEDHHLLKSSTSLEDFLFKINSPAKFLDRPLLSALTEVSFESLGGRPPI